MMLVRLSGNARGADDMVEDETTFVLKRAIFASESLGVGGEGGGGGGGGGFLKKKTFKKKKRQNF